MCGFIWPVKITSPSTLFMATVSSVTLVLVDAPRIHYGFWHSFGTIFQKGPILTVSNTVYTFLASGIALYTAWIASRAWVILDLLIFRSISDRTRTSLEESQCAVLLVNSTTPMIAFSTASQLMKRGGPKNTLTRILFAAFLVLLLKAAIPGIIALFPTKREGLIKPTNCGFLPGNDSYGSYDYYTKRSRFSDAALISGDQHRTESAIDRKARTTLAPLPKPATSYTLACPARATCHPDHPFTFSSVYTLTPEIMGLNIDLSFSVQVSDTCYRPIDAFSPINSSLSPIPYGLYYGSLNLSDSYTDAVLDFTDLFYLEQNLAPGYALRAYSSLANDSSGFNYWYPNSTLVLGGDTTILFYFIGNVYQTQPSDDPIFATNSTPLPSLTVGTVYSSRYIVTPIICDTKYKLCANDGRDCSPAGPRNDVLDWITNTRAGSAWQDVYILFDASTLFPPISAASWGSGVVASSHTLIQTNLQTDTLNNTVARELSRLSQGGSTMFASGSQLAALGYWSHGQQSDAMPINNLCQSVIIQTNVVVSLLLTPYIIYVFLTLLVVVISYADIFGSNRFGLLKGYRDLWNLYSVGQLHREVAERHGGRIRNPHASKPWPDLKSTEYMGFDVLERDGSKYLTPVSPEFEKSAFPPFPPPLPYTAVSPTSPDSITGPESKPLVAEQISSSYHAEPVIASPSSASTLPSRAQSSYFTAPPPNLDISNLPEQGQLDLGGRSQSGENTASLVFPIQKHTTSTAKVNTNNADRASLNISVPATVHARSIPSFPFGDAAPKDVPYDPYVEETYNPYHH